MKKTILFLSVLALTCKQSLAILDIPNSAKWGLGAIISGYCAKKAWQSKPEEFDKQWATHLRNGMAIALKAKIEKEASLGAKQQAKELLRQLPDLTDQQILANTQMPANYRVIRYFLTGLCGIASIYSAIMTVDLFLSK